MRDLFARLRAVITPQALMAFAAALLLLVLSFSGSGEGDASALEKRTARVLSSISGAGRVRVVIRMQTQETEQGLSGSCVKAIPAGAVAAAQGADDPLIRLELQEALCALLSLPASSVSIVAGGD